MSYRNVGAIKKGGMDYRLSENLKSVVRYPIPEVGMKIYVQEQVKKSLYWKYNPKEKCVKVLQLCGRNIVCQVFCDGDNSYTECFRCDDFEKGLFRFRGLDECSFRDAIGTDKEHELNKMLL